MLQIREMHKAPGSFESTSHQGCQGILKVNDVVWHRQRVEVWMSGSCHVWPLFFFLKRILGPNCIAIWSLESGISRNGNCLAGKGSWKNSDDWSKTLTCGISTLLRSYVIWKDISGYIFSCRCVTLLVDKLLHQLIRKVPGFIPPRWCRMWSITSWKNAHCYIATLLGS